MLISVILPVRNGGVHLAQAVASVLAQTLGDFELLLIDDHSTDGAVDDLPAALADDPRLVKLANPGRGLVAALNFGLWRAQAPLIARMDADDVCLPGRFRAQADFLDRNPSVALVATQVAYIDEQGRPSGRVSTFPTEPEAVATALRVQGCVIRHPSVLARREAFARSGGYREAMTGAEDYDLWLRLAERERLANLPEVWLQYREHGGQISHGVNLKQRFARDLAVYAERERRAGRPDPFGAGEDRSVAEWSLADEDGRFAEPLRRLRSAYRAAGFLEGTRSEAPGGAEMADALAAAEAGFLGDGRRYRAVVAARLADYARRRGEYGLALKAARAALRGGVSRALPVLLGLGPRR